LPQKQKLQTKSTPARGGESTASDAATVARDECLKKLHSVTTDAWNFHFQLVHAPKGNAVVALWSEYPKQETQWLRDLCGAVTGYVTRLQEHRADIAWVKSEVEKNWKSFEEERQKWTDIICEILRHAGTQASKSEGAEPASSANEQERAVQAAKIRLAREFAAAKDAALSFAEVALAQKQTTSPEPGNVAQVEKLTDKKNDMARYFDSAKLTDKQREVASLAWEYGLTVAEIARRTGKHRKTVDELRAAAEKKIDQATANERSARRQAAKNEPTNPN
jgi:DNA-binding CsgD family transcriptional regulator